MSWCLKLTWSRCFDRQSVSKHNPELEEFVSVMKPRTWTTLTYIVIPDVQNSWTVKTQPGKLRIHPWGSNPLTEPPEQLVWEQTLIRNRKEWLGNRKEWPSIKYSSINYWRMFGRPQVLHLYKFPIENCGCPHFDSVKKGKLIDWLIN